MSVTPISLGAERGYALAVEEGRPQGGLRYEHNHERELHGAPEREHHVRAKARSAAVVHSSARITVRTRMTCIGSAGSAERSS